VRPAGGQLHPPADIKAARDVICYRAKVVQSKTSEVQRLGNVLQDAGIKTDSVASSIVTKSGRSMIESLTDGERRPEVLAELAIGRCGRRSRTWRWRWRAASASTTR
jgi:transposase